MSDRGYLWENLADEIVDEFDDLGALPSYLELQKSGGGFHEIQYSTAEVKPELTGPERSAKHYERSAAVGQCVKCAQPARPNKKTCQKCTDKATERQRLRRRGMRERLADVRMGVTHHFTIITKTPDEDGVQEIDGYVQTGVYEDGRLGEIFIRIGKTGATEAMYEQWAIAASMALQYGVPVEAFFRKFLGTRFEPSGATANKDIKRCTSVLDYVSRWVLLKYAPVQTQEEVQP